MSKQKKIQNNISPLCLVANVSAAMNKLDFDRPIISIVTNGNELIITLDGGQIEHFPIDYTLTITQKDIDHAKKSEESLRLALSALGRDNNSKPGWLPKVDL